MTAQTLTLTDFLLARIAEDEESARTTKAIFDARPFAERAAAQFVSGVGFQRPNGLGTDDRVLAECEAKRRRVTAGDEWAALCPPDDWPATGDISAAQVADTGRWLLRTEALPYADHPDYREAWRP